MRMHVFGIQINVLFPRRHALFRVGLLSVSFCLLMNFADRSAFAGPWTLAKGNLYVNYSFISTKYNKVELYDGTHKDVGDVRTLSNRVFIKYGALDNLDIHMDIPYELTSLEGDPASTTRKFGDGRFGFQYRFLRENDNAPVSLALGFEWKTPLSSYPATNLSSLGDHQDDYEYRFLVGRYFDIFNLTSYANIEGGYRTRTGKTPDEVFGFGEIGVLFTPKVAGRVFVDGVDALGGIGLESPEFMDIMMQDGTMPFPRVGENYIKAGVGFSFYPNNSVDVGIFWSIPVYRSNTSFDSNMGISIGYKFF